MLKKTLAIVLCAAVVSGGCASSSGGRVPVQSAPAIDPATLSDYAQRIPAGSRVRLERTTGEVMRGTLMKATAQSIIIQKNTRVPEAPVEVPLGSVARLTLDTGAGGTSTAKAIGIGVASGVGAFFAIIAIIAATLDD